VRIDGVRIVLNYKFLISAHFYLYRTKVEADVGVVARIHMMFVVNQYSFQKK